MKKIATYIKNHIPLRQVIPLILLTIMFRLAIVRLYEFSIEFYIGAYGNESLNAYVSGLHIVLTGFGIFMCLYAIVVYIV